MIDNIFHDNLLHLESLFGKTLVSLRQNRLQEIYEIIETSWYKNIDRLKNRKVENILIAEAPPWSEKGTKPRYFYNKIESKYHENIWKAFYPDVPIPTDKETSYQMLADKNFLLVDSIPFSMKYSSAKRHHSSYHIIVSNSIDWWTRKLANENLILADKVKIAFAFKLNGQSVIKATAGQLKLKNNEVVKLTEDLIAADGSGYTNSKALRQLFKL